MSYQSLCFNLQQQQQQQQFAVRMLIFVRILVIFGESLRLFAAIVNHFWGISKFFIVSVGEKTLFSSFNTLLLCYLEGIFEEFFSIVLMVILFPT